MENYFNFMFGWWQLFLPQLQNPKKKPCRRTAKFKITRTRIIESIFYSDADDADKAKEEAWTAFNINKGGVMTAPKKVDMTVELNPDRTIDDDGFDTVTGIEYR